MARADERVNGHLARQVQIQVEAAAASAPHSGGASSSSGGVAPVRAAPAQGGQGVQAPPRCRTSARRSPWGT
eukprot:4566390-Alexandrium_andersonii.AAC.1